MNEEHSKHLSANKNEDVNPEESNITDSVNHDSNPEVESTTGSEKTETENLKDLATPVDEADVPAGVSPDKDAEAKDVSSHDSEEQFLASERVSLDKDDDGDEESDDDHDDSEQEEQEDLSTFSLEELISKLEAFVDEVEVPRFKSRISTIRDLISESLSARNDEMLERFLADGGLRDDFEPTPDPLDERFHNAIKKFNKKKTEYRRNIEKERQQNLDGKRDILEKLKDLIQNEENMGKAFNRFHELQADWRALGPVPSADVRDLHMTYKLMVDKFYDYIKINRELQELDQRKNMESKLLLCEQAEALILEPSINNSFKQLHLIQDKWREIGPVPRDKKDEVWDRFKTACDKIFEKRREYIQKTSEQRQKNLEAKAKLCEEAEAISPDENAKHKDWQELTEKLSEIQNAWRKIGRADKKFNDEIWSRFKKACDVFYKAKNDFYQARKQEFSANLQLKTELCIQAEALSDNTDWKSTTAELIKLQEEWKKIGHVGERQSEKIWKRFRKACDAFFKNKSEHFANRDKDFEENYIKKTELIDRIEQFNPGENHQQAFEELKNFQREWNELGMVPIKKKDEINKKYKTVIDAQFDKIKISSADRQKMRYQNKLEQIRNAHDPKRMSNERRFLMNKISELKNEVQTWENNIGFFAKSKNAEKLKEEFEGKIAKAHREIEDLNSKLEMTKE